MVLLQRWFVAICATLTILSDAPSIAGFSPTIGDRNEAILKSADVFGSNPSEIDLSSTDGLTKDVLDTASLGKEYSTKTRKKRMVPIISKALTALAKVLSKSKGVTPYTMYTESYMKPGNFGSALQDFESFGPKHIKHSTTKAGVRVIQGQAEGFKLKIRSPGYRRDSLAVLEITELAAKEGDRRRTYNIMYMQKDKIY